MATRPENKVQYAVVRGTVKPIGPPMHSVLSPSVTGVLQVIKLNEHRGIFGDIVCVRAFTDCLI